MTLEGAPNFRELGGLRTGDGRAVRRGLLYRSEALAELTDRDLVAVAELGIRLACDLRTSTERERHASRWPEGRAPDVLAVDVLADARALGKEELRALLGDETGAGPREWMLRNYRAMPASFAPGFRALVERIVDREQLPLVIHCAAGRDRTGFVCSLLLLALGVRYDEVVEEYLRSDRHFGPDRLARVMAVLAGDPSLPVAPRAVEAFMGREEYLEAAFDAIETTCGGRELYFEVCGGLDAQRRERLQEVLLTAA